MTNAELKKKLESLRDKCMGNAVSNVDYDEAQAKALSHIMDAIDALYVNE